MYPLVGLAKASQLKITRLRSPGGENGALNSSTGHSSMISPSEKSRDANTPLPLAVPVCLR